MRTPPLRLNGERSAVVHHLVTHCGMSREDAERVIPVKATGETSRRALTAKQLSTFRGAVNSTVRHEALKRALLLLPLTGLRVSEVCGLLRENVLVAGEKVVLRVHGKGDKWRDVVLSAKAKAALASYRPAGRSPYYFPGIQGGKLTTAALQKACSAIAARHPSLDALTPHVLRHSYATQFGLTRCGDLNALRKQLGHNSLKTTLIYLHGGVE